MSFPSVVPNPVMKTETFPNKFVAGNTQYCIEEWKKITSDPFILLGVAGIRIDFEAIPLQKEIPRKFHMSVHDKLKLDFELQIMFEKGIVEEACASKGQFISNLFTVPKPSGRHRVILDLSRLNEDVVYNHFKMDNLQSAMELLSRDCFMASIDLQDAYYSIPIYLADRKFLRFYWNDKLFQYTCLPNGLALAPRYFSKFLKPVFSALQEKGFTCFGYIDDTFILHETKEGCRQTTEILAQMLTKLGFTINQEKSVFIPSKQLTFLGFILDSEKMCIFPTEKKIVKFEVLAKDFLKRKTHKIRDLARVIGTIIDLTKGVEYGMNHYRLLEQDKIQALNLNKGNFDAKMVTSQLARLEIKWWLNNIREGRRRVWTEKPDHSIVSDASNLGWGAVVDGSNCIGWPWGLKDHHLHINAKETLACFLGIKTFLNEESNCLIKSEVDNTTAVAYINHMGGMKSTQCQSIAKDLWNYCEQKQIWLTAVHIAGVKNVEADYYSRNFQENLEWETPLAVFSDLSRAWGPFGVDLFASRLNNKCDVYFSWLPDPGASKTNAFLQDWPDSNWFAFPPFSCVAKTLQKIRMEGNSGVLLTPNWTAQRWYGALLRISKNRWLLGKHHLINSVNGEKWHLPLVAWKI